jgi:hypothetical protein
MRDQTDSSRITTMVEQWVTMDYHGWSATETYLLHPGGPWPATAPQLFLKRHRPGMCLCSSRQQPSRWEHGQTCAMWPSEVSAKKPACIIGRGYVRCVCAQCRPWLQSHVSMLKLCSSGRTTTSSEWSGTRATSPAVQLLIWQAASLHAPVSCHPPTYHWQGPTLMTPAHLRAGKCCMRVVQFRVARQKQASTQVLIEHDARTGCARNHRRRVQV